MESLYIAIPSVWDTELLHTIHRCIYSSSMDREINVGIGYLFRENEKFSRIENSNIKFKTINRKNFMGIGVARRESFSFYNGEDYFLQIDGHMFFKKNWDSILIEKLHSSPNEKSILSCYPPSYYYADYYSPKCKGWNNKYISKFNTRTIMDRTPHSYGCIACEEFSCFPGWDEEKISPSTNKYINNPKLSGGFIFSDKRFAKEYLKLLPYDYSFFDDEIVMSIEAHNLGWKFYCPPGEIPIAHLYAEDINSYGGERSSLVEDEVLKLNVKSNYLNYVLDPNNRNKIEKFEKYANVKILELAESESRKVENRTAILSQRLDKCEGS